MSPCLPCRPYYYSAGAALFAPARTIPGVANWTDLAGRTVAIKQGYYAIEDLEQLGIDLLFIETYEGGQARRQGLLCRGRMITAWGARCAARQQVPEVYKQQERCGGERSRCGPASDCASVWRPELQRRRKLLQRGGRWRSSVTK